MVVAIIAAGVQCPMQDKTTGSVKAAVEGMDREVAQQIVELVRRI